MRFSIYYIILLALSASKLKAQRPQELTIKLLKETNLANHRKMISPARLLSTEKSISKFTGVPKDIDTFSFFAIDMQYKQSLFQRFQLGEIDSVIYLNARKTYNVDEKKLSKNYINQQINVFSGIKNNQKIIICDTNSNNDFSDEIIQRYDLSNKNNIKLDSLKSIEVTYDYYYQGKVHKRKSMIKLIPFDKTYRYKDTLQQALFVYVSIAERKVGKFNIGLKTYTVTLPYTFNRGGDYSNQLVVFSDSLDQNIVNIDPLPIVGDLFVLEENIKVKILEISEFGDSLKLNIWKSKEVNTGIRAGDQTILKPFQTIEDKLFSPKNTYGKYILLDFWGTWCKPCIEGLPKLKDFYQKNKSKIEIVSIAFDKDIEKVKKFITNNKMNWVHKFEDNTKKWPDSLVEKLKVECYPTFILLDKSGKILFRGCEEKQLEEIEKILE